MWQFFLSNASQMVFFLQNFFHLLCGFWLKIREFLLLEKLESMIKKQCFEKKRFRPSKTHLNKVEGQNLSWWWPGVLLLLKFYNLAKNTEKETMTLLIE